MKKLFLIILTFFIFSAFGQNHLIGIKGGVSLTNITSGNQFVQNNPRKGLNTGITYEYLLNKYFLVGVDLVYNQRGYRYDITFTDASGKPFYEKYMVKYNYDYLSIPIKTGFNIGNKFFGFTNIGAVPSILINAKVITLQLDSDGKISGNSKSDIKNQVSILDLAGFAEIGCGYKFNNRYWLSTSFAYQQSLTAISKDFLSSKIRHQGVSFTIGLKYAIIKE